MTLDYTKEADRIGQTEIKDMWEATGYSIDDAHENDPLGFLGYNCRHTYYVWHEGSSQLNDFAKEEVPPPVEINGKMYDYYALTQKQRAMERGIRALKREREAMSKLQMDTAQVNRKIKTKIREYEDFCKKYKVPEKYNNIRYDAGSSDIKKTQAWKEYEEMKKSSSDLLRIPQFPASTIDKKITEGEYSLKLSEQEYYKHAQGHAKYEEYLKSRLEKGRGPQSILTVSMEEAQDIIDKYHGTGIIKTDMKGNPKPQELVNCDKVVGKYCSKNEYYETKKAMIIYGKKKAHIVPVKGENYD